MDPKLKKINNPAFHEFLNKYVELCNPGRIFVCTDSKEDIQYIRDAAIRNKEEAKLAIKGHTVHFDGPQDQARDKKMTKYLLPKNVNLGPEINAMDREEGIKEMYGILKNIMEGRELYVKFFCLGPVNSIFSIYCVQLTDSAYVGHSGDLLYRQGYEEFCKLGHYEHFFKFVHSQGELIEAGLGLQVSKNVEKRRVYIDLRDKIIYSVNTQYGGNTIGLKKLSMRLAISRASKEGWLTEHMFVMGVHGPEGRVSYFAGAFPSLCGKTTTAMVEGESILGDDIAYFRNVDGKMHAVNVEKGMFGIIDGINSIDDPLQWNALQNSGERIFSNVLVTEARDVYWNGKDGECPEKGINYAGQWSPGNTPPSHKNARFTLELKSLDNVDPMLEAREGVEIKGIVYGGRDSDTWVPVEEAFDWARGIITKGAALESETTAATLGKEGVRVFNPMSNLDFLSITIGRYINDNLNFGAGLKTPPRIFSVNYFLKDSDGEFMNCRKDKRVWLKWMELRVHGDVGAIKTPTGFIPRYQDLKKLFKEILNKDYLEEDYVKQFTARIPENLAKVDRLIKIYKERVLDTPQIIFEIFEEVRRDLKDAQAKYGDYIPPDKFADA